MAEKMPFFSRDKRMYKSFFAMTMSIAFQNLIVYGVNLADNIMIGKWQIILSGIALVNQIQFLLQMIINGVAEGMIVIASRHWGSGNTDGIKKVSSIAMLIGLILSVVMWGAMYFLPSQVLGLLTEETEVIAQGVKYAKIVCFSYVFFAITNVITGIMRSVETTKLGIYVSVTALFVNVILNYFLINGVWIFPRLLGEGAAIATLVSRIVETAVVIIYITFRDKKLKLRLKDFFRLKIPVIKEYFRVGSPVIISGTMWGFIQLGQTAILGHLDGDVIAANSIATTVFSIVSVAVYGSASASSVLIGKTLGEGRRDVIKSYTHSLQVIYILLGLITGAILFFLKDIIIGFYDVTPLAREYSIQFMTVLSVTVVGTAYQMTCLSGICRGGGDTKTIMINDFAVFLIVVFPLSYCAAFVWKLAPVWVFLCLKSDQITKCLVAAIRTNSYRWIKDVGVKK